MKNLTTIILAAGKGTRMKSPLPKVLHTVGGQPMLCFSLETALRLRSHPIVVVVPKEDEPFQKLTKNFFPKNKFRFAIQEKRLGTGHAVRIALKEIPSRQGSVLVLNGDMPFVNLENIKKLLKEHKGKKAAVSLLVAEKDFPQGFGRVLRERGKIKGIVEEKEATEEQKKITEVNLGVYVFEMKFLRFCIGKIQNKNAQKEYYLPDLIDEAVKKNLSIGDVCLEDGLDSLGINSKEELAIANHGFYFRQYEKLFQNGVTILGHDVFVDAGVKVGAGTQLASPCYLKNKTRVGKNVTIESGTVITSSVIEEECLIKANCYLDKAHLKKNVQIGPFAHLRPGTILEEGVRIGNFVEIKKSRLGKNSKANHLSYLGDARIGQKVNIGAGTITCNYDGKKKLPTIIEDGVFIGSDTQLVAPVRIGKGAYVGAGTTITKNVPAHSLALSRIPQKEILNWTKQRGKN